MPCPRSGRLSGFSTAILYIMYHTVEGWVALFSLSRISLDKGTKSQLRVPVVEFLVKVMYHIVLKSSCDKSNSIIFLTRMEGLKGRKTMTAKSPNGVPGPSRFSSRRLNLVYLSPLLSTPASHPTRATYVPPSASPTIPSPCPPTRLRRSSALFVRALASTSPLSCLLLQPAARACRLLQPLSQQHAACCAPVSEKIKISSSDLPELSTGYIN